MNKSKKAMESTNFLGVIIDILTYQDMFDFINEWISNKSGRSHHIACINAYCTVLATKNKELLKIYNSADIAGPDGMPFVKWIRNIKKKTCDRFYAPDVVVQLVRKSKKTKYSFYLIGGAPEVVNKMKTYMTNRFPYVKIIGYNSPPFRILTKEEDETLCAEINRLKPDILLVGLGTPKQDYWINDHIYKIRGAVFIACGATFDFFGGRIKMAPKIIQNSGFEWLYRLFSKDIIRLWKRYTIFNILFLWNFILQLIGLRFKNPYRSHRSD